MLHHHRRGSGSPIVLIHGLGSRWQVWHPVLDALAERHDVIALDLPGFGGTPPDDGDGSVPHLADRVAAFLDETGVREPAVGGSSLGGGVALELGRRGLARSVTAFSPVGFFGWGGARWCRGVVGAARAGGSLLGPALPRLMATRAGRIALCGLFSGRPGALPPAECVADARALIGAPGFAAARRSIGGWRFPGPGRHRSHPMGVGARIVDLGGPIQEIPVTIAWGSRDLVLPHPQAGRARALLPTARHVSLPGCGHLPFTDDPQTCARLLLESA
jgi:pimeloyl-ACP methyl ester carboxylesterase